MRFFTTPTKVIISGVLIFCVSLVLTVLIFKINQDQERPPTSSDAQAQLPEQTFLEAVQPERTDLLPPDLSIKPPVQLYIAGTNNSKQLRFNTTFVNLGPGALEVLGHKDLENELTYATQYIFADGAPGEYRDIGSFELHPTHSHWHVIDHVVYQLWSISDSGERNEKLADTGKMSFCLWDEHTNDLTIENAPQSRFYGFTCDRNTQGMSVGWADTYAARVDGQELDVTNIPDGEYILYFEVNPDKKIYEVGYENNWGELKVKIEGFGLTIL